MPGRLCAISSPLGKVVGSTVPRISTAVAGHFEAYLVTVSLNAFGDGSVADFGDIGNTFTLHVSGVVAILTDWADDDGFVFDVANHVVVDVGLVVAPRAHKDVANFDIGLGSFDFGHLRAVEHGGGVVALVVDLGSVEGAVAFSLPHTKL